MTQGHDPAPIDLPPFTVLDEEGQTPVVCLTGLPEGLLKKVVELKDDSLPGKNSGWYILSQRAKALRFNRKEAAAGNREVQAALEDDTRWTLPMPLEWPNFVSQEHQSIDQSPDSIK